MHVTTRLLTHPSPSPRSGICSPTSTVPGTIERERPLEQDEVLVLDGQRWRVMNTIGVSGHVTRA
jgi:hypothetical protein